MIHYRKDPETTAIVQRVRDKIHTPALVGLLGWWWHNTKCTDPLFGLLEAGDLARQKWRFEILSSSVGLCASETHAAVERLNRARLIDSARRPLQRKFQEMLVSE